MFFFFLFNMAVTPVRHRSSRNWLIFASLKSGHCEMLMIHKMCFDCSFVVLFFKKFSFFDALLYSPLFNARQAHNSTVYWIFVFVFFQAELLTFT